MKQPLWWGTMRRRAAAPPARRLATRAMAGIPVLITVLAFLVAGCGQGIQAGAGASTSTQAQNCGTVTIHQANNSTDASASTPESCFYSAYQKCASATLTVTTMGVDAGTTRTFTTQANNATCRITDAVSTYVVPHPPSTAKTYTCTDLTKQSDGLHFSSCGADGNVFVPTPSA